VTTQLGLFSAAPPRTPTFWRGNGFWGDDVFPYLKWTGSGHGETNTLSVIGMPPALREAALVWRAPCVACGEFMNPIRERQKRNPSDRRTEKASMYVAVACSTEHRPGCGRGRAAAEAFAELHRLVP